MTQLPDAQDVALWLAQCKAWANELADLERWPDALRADILDRLRRAPAVSLQAQAEHFRVRLNEARERAGAAPANLREHREDPAQTSPPQKPKWRRTWEEKKAAEVFKSTKGECA